ANFAAAFTARPKNSKQPSTVSSNTTTKTRSPLSGTKPPTRSSIQWPGFVNELTTQDTRRYNKGVCRCHLRPIGHRETSPSQKSPLGFVNSPTFDQWNENKEKATSKGVE